MNELKPRKQITFFRSYYEIGNELESDKARLEWYDTIMKIQFLEVHIDNIEIKNKELKILFISIKHSLQTSIEGYCAKMKINYASLFYDTKQPLPNPLATPSEQVQEQEQEKEKGGHNTSLRSVTLSLKSKSDVLNNQPRKVIKELDEKYVEELKDEVLLEYVIKFIEYRDDMYSTTKDKKYGLKTTRAVFGFINQLVECDNTESAFQMMEDNEWASVKKEWVDKEKRKYK